MENPDEGEEGQLRKEPFHQHSCKSLASTGGCSPAAVTATTEGSLHLHELKDLSNEHASEAILLMQVIDVRATVKENSMETPLG